MSVALHERVALTPRNPDQSARRSVPSACTRSGRSARSAELIGLRGMTGHLWRQPDNSIASVKFPGRRNLRDVRCIYPSYGPRVDAIGLQNRDLARTLNATPHRLAGPEVLG